MKNFLSFVLTPLLLLVSLNYSQAQDEEFGLASYYSDEFHGRKTAYGDTYNKDKLTTAHKKHPYGTILKVTRLDNSKSVTVKVIDKGPFIRGRVVDLSRKAAERIGLIDVGVAEVKVEVVSKMATERPSADIASAKPKTTVPKDRPVAFSDESSTSSRSSSSRPSTSSNQSTRSTTTPKSSTKARSSASVSREKSSSSSSRSSSRSKDVLTSKGSTKSSSKARLVTQDYTKYGLYKIVLEKPSKKGYGVQVASLSNYENVLRQVADLQSKWFDNILLSVEKGQAKPVYKIILGPFDSESQALSYKKDLSRKHKVKGFVVSLDEIEY